MVITINWIFFFGIRFRDVLKRNHVEVITVRIGPKVQQIELEATPTPKSVPPEPLV